jgi:hypothetical protein
MANNNYKKLDKIALANWLNKALNVPFPKETSRMGSRL